VSTSGLRRTTSSPLGSGSRGRAHRLTRPSSRLHVSRRKTAARSLLAARAMNSLLSDGLSRSTVAALGVAVLAACGGSTVSSPAADSGQTTHDSGDRHDTGSSDASDHRDVGSSDASSRRDATRTADAELGGNDAAGDAKVATVCMTPVIDDGGTVSSGCAEAHCPSGTVCIQIDSDVTALAKCASIPSACAGTPTCACMGPEALACGRPGTEFTDSGIGPGTCQDEGEGGGIYLDLPCGCA
jgi:hypothetical protein